MTPNHRRRISLASLAAGTLPVLLAACAVGPDFVAPAAPVAGDYAPAGLPARTESAPVTGGGEQRFVPGAEVPADWWTTLRNPDLDALVRRALAASPTIEAAQATLAAANETVRAQQGLAYPTLQASYAGTHTRQATDPSVPLDTVRYTLHTAQLTVGFVPDVFGANARQVEALQAQADVQAFQLRAAQVTLAANLAAAAIQDAVLREQMGVVQQMIDAGLASVDIAQRQHRAGYVSRLDLSLQESALAQNQLLLPPLRKQFEQNRDLLRALAGGGPDSDVPDFTLAGLALPADLPLSLPAQLVHQRPDVRAAEAQLHAATAQVGVARAARLPQFNLTADAGASAAQIAQLASGGFFGITAGVAQTLLDAGTLQSREQAARQVARQAEAQYRQAVLTALQNVADTLHALDQDAQALAAAARQARSTQTALELARRQYGNGYLDRVALIAMEQMDRQARLAVAQATAARLSDTVALFQALGGGWWQATQVSQYSAWKRNE
jgi:NodT family efflux transporter outer membrane factor (OMF) lipoprotein